MKLFQHADFDQAVLQAAEHFGARRLRPAVIEKDYYVTEALRIIAAAGDKVIFKGGTSLAKGYDLFQLAGQEDVVAMLKSDEYAAIKADYDTISRTHFERSYFRPRR